MLKLGVKTGDSIFFLKDERVVGEIVVTDAYKHLSLLFDFWEEPDGFTILRDEVLMKHPRWKQIGARLIADFREGR